MHWTFVHITLEWAHRTNTLLNNPLCEKQLCHRSPADMYTQPPHHIPQAMTDALTGRLINDPSGLGMHIGAQSI